MAEDGSTAVSLPSSPFHKNASPFSSSFRFLRFADQRNSPPSSGNHHELDEGDVVWSPDLYSDLSAYADADSPTSTLSASAGGDSSPGSPSYSRRRPFLPERFGLSAALAEKRGLPMQHRRAAINVPVGKKAAAAEVSKVFQQSAPVNVPAWPRGRLQPAGALVEVDEGGEEDEAEEMLPPHLIVARSHVMTFSVFEGVGRTLKGRDLRRVRNAVFQKTGFLD